ncbi:hypothetical protein J5X84_35985 [Streptosporangiaceae bacterium NEAU-GS5]|nr:hypothetical protein [Streptosporangiaceae bacterium NEAU-GS5]
MPADPRAPLTIADLEARFPRWTIWQSDTGRWWATSGDALTLDQQAAGCQATVNADTADGLWDVLLEQERLREDTAR